MARQFDVIVIGAGAAGLMCAATAGYRGRSVLVLDHAGKVGRKIAISGGGSCNFTNLHVGVENYLCSNPHFVKSALARYSANDFVELIERHGIEYHERDHGQLFCNDNARQIVELLRNECDWAGVTITLDAEITGVERPDDQRFEVQAGGKQYQSESLVIATGGLSITQNGGDTTGLSACRAVRLERRADPVRVWCRLPGMPNKNSRWARFPGLLCQPVLPPHAASNLARPCYLRIAACQARRSCKSLIIGSLAKRFV